MLIEIADKCNVSLDWLAGRSSFAMNLSSMKEFVIFLYELSMKNEIGFKIEVEDKFDDDIDDTK